MLDIWYSDVMAFTRDCVACGYDATQLLLAGDYVMMIAIGHVVAREYAQ